MKSFLCGLFLLVASFQLSAQNLDAIEAMVTKKDLPGAKAGIDKYLSDPKNSSKPEGWYYKGYIYNALSYEPATPANEKIGLKSAAFEAFKKNQELDPSDKRMKLSLWKPYLELYYGYYDLGANFFNEKNYKAAFESFVKAQEVEDYIHARKYTYNEAKLYPLDTALVMNTAVAASQAKDQETALKYYQKLIDANVGGQGYAEVYEYVGGIYADQKNLPALEQVLAKARKLYPENTYWNELEMKASAKDGDNSATLAKYEQMHAKYPNDFVLGYNYAVELFNSMYGRDAKPASEEMRKRLTDLLTQIIPLDKGIEAVTLMGNHKYNIAVDYLTESSMIKGTRPEDSNKRKALNATAMKYMDEYIPYAEQAIKWYDAQPSLTSVQKANYRSLLSNLKEIYIIKKDTKKADEYSKKASTLN